MLGRTLSGAVGLILGSILITQFWETAVTYIPYEDVVFEQVTRVPEGVVITATFEKTACVYKSMSVIQIPNSGRGGSEQRDWRPWFEPDSGDRPVGIHTFNILVETPESEFGSLVLVTTHLCADDERTAALTATRDLAGTFEVEEVVKVFAIVNLE